MRKAFALVSVTALLAALPAQAADPSAVSVERTAPSVLTLRWTGAGPMDVLAANTPDMSAATVISKADADGKHEVSTPASERLYFALRETKGGKTVKAAERVLPLSQGSNFRDLGGYPAAGGKHVRWGMIYRSGATPLLSDADLAEIKAIKFAHMVDLRSSEERVLAPSRIEGVPYSAIGYSMTAMMPTDPAKIAQPTAMPELYATMPEFFAPQVKLVFDKLLSGDGPVVYNCSAGQDRTGFVSAVILSALGVSRATIIEDYHLSTTWRRPEWEMPKLDPAAHPGDPVVAMFARYSSDPVAAKPRPLKTEDGAAYLQFALAAIDKRWGSVDNYLRQEAGLTNADLAALRKAYLE